jgi:membrane-associated phospholipid phosphatase
MHHRSIARIATLAGLFGSVARPAHSQSVGRMVMTDVKNAAGDMWDVWISPFRARPSDWLAASAVVGFSAAVSPLDDNVDRWAASHRDDNAFQFLRPFREGGIAFSGRTITPAAAGLLVVGLATRNETLQDGLFGCVSSYAASSVVRTYVVYPLVARTRPDSGRGEQPPPARSGDQYKISFPGSSDWGRQSLPGGHVANVMACAGFLTQRFSMGVAEPVVWALAGGVAMSRTLDRRHWFSDEVLGGLFGYAVGKEVAERSRRRAERTSSRSAEHDDSGFFLSPRIDGINVGWQRTF